MTIICRSILLRVSVFGPLCADARNKTMFANWEMKYMARHLY